MNIKEGPFGELIIKCDCGRQEHYYGRSTAFHTAMLALAEAAPPTHAPEVREEDDTQPEKKGGTVTPIIMDEGEPVDIDGVRVDIWSPGKTAIQLALKPAPHVKAPNVPVVAEGLIKAIHCNAKSFAMDFQPNHAFPLSSIGSALSKTLGAPVTIAISPRGSSAKLDK